MKIIERDIRLSSTLDKFLDISFQEVLETENKESSVSPTDGVWCYGIHQHPEVIHSACWFLLISWMLFKECCHSKGGYLTILRKQLLPYFFSTLALIICIRDVNQHLSMSHRQKFATLSRRNASGVAQHVNTFIKLKLYILDRER